MQLQSTYTLHQKAVTQKMLEDLDIDLLPGFVDKHYVTRCVSACGTRVSLRIATDVSNIKQPCSVRECRGGIGT